MELQSINTSSSINDSEDIEIDNDNQAGNESLINRHNNIYYNSSSSSSSSIKKYLNYILLIIIIILLIIIVARMPKNSSNTSISSEPEPSKPTPKSEKCIKEYRQRYNPKFKGNGAKVLNNNNGDIIFINVTIFTADDSGTILPNTNIIIRDGIIRNISPNVDDLSINKRINGHGLFLTPGLVDMHSHAGVYAWPEIWATSDGNEMTNPTTSQVRAIDAFDPEDWAIPHIVRGGITTSQVLPGSGNLMGGEGGIFKMRGKTVNDMFIENSPRILKMACGENPKRVYGRKGQMPMSRMGSAWLMRHRFDRARQIKEAQDRWCADDTTTTPFPYDLELESLVSLLRNEAVLNVHCYQVQDLEMMIRLSDEFNFRIAAFHHALEAYKIADIIRDRNITVATFSDLWGYKYEAYDASVRSPSILRSHNAQVALKSDHPVIDANTLMYEAAKAYHYGLSATDALKAVTSVPARAINMFDSIGSVEVSKSADLVLWDRHPLRLGAKPLKVTINGELIVDEPINNDIIPDNKPLKSQIIMTADEEFNCHDNTFNVVDNNVLDYAIIDVTVHTSDSLLTGQTIIVNNGTITCMSSTSCNTNNIPKIIFSGSGEAHLTPGFVDAGSGIGQLEIDADGSTQDGSISSSGSSGKSAGVHAYDGIRIFSRHVRAAWSAGILTSIAHPQGNQVLGGLSTAFDTCWGESGCPESIDNLLINKTVALHISIGNQAKDTGLAASISGEIEILRILFENVKTKYDNSTVLEDIDISDRPLVQALRHEIVVVAEVYQADAIASVVRLAEEYNFRFTILGGAEAGVVANLLKSATNLQGVLIQASTPPSTFDTSRFKPTDIVKLNNLGIKVGLYVSDPDNGRNLRFEAGKAIEYGLNEIEALKAITSNVREMFGLPPSPTISVGKKAHFVVFDENPFTLTSQVKLIAKNTQIHCNPQQF